MITAIVLAHNEEKNITDCLSSLSFCDEILVIDDLSTDATATHAKKHGATVIEHALDGDWAAARNFGVEKATYDWILFVDADERVHVDLQKEILSTVNEGKYQTASLKRRDWFWNHEMKWGETHTARSKGIIRLVKKGSGRWVGKVHEEYRQKTGDTNTLNNFLEHYPHQTIAEFLESVNVYSTVRARELHRNHKKFSLGELLFVPPLKFVYTYFVKLGFLDGAAGFVYSFMMSFHSFLVRAKLYMLYEK